MRQAFVFYGIGGCVAHFYYKTFIPVLSWLRETKRLRPFTHCVAILNWQKPAKQVLQMGTETKNKVLTLPVMEAFYTLQGEGYHQGKAAYFIRLGGCDVGCFWCDVKESWDASKHPMQTIAHITDGAKKYPAPIVVVTGGEPLMHNLDDLTKALHEAGFKTNIETSGSYPLSGEWDWICLSPKKFKAPLPEVLPVANELKVVIYNRSDFVWAENYAAQAGENCKLYLQPEWNKSNIVTPLIIDYIKANPKWELSLQLHKYINVP